MKRLIIIDSNSLIHRAFHALPPLTTKNGEIVNAVYGFLLAFFRIIKEFNPDYIAACFDLPFPTFRHKKFVEYKAHRVKTSNEIIEQIPKVKQMIKAFSVPIFQKKGFEADDIIGTIARKMTVNSSRPYFSQKTEEKTEVKPPPKDGGLTSSAGVEGLTSSAGQAPVEIIILSGDLDLLQIVNENTKVFSLRKGIKHTVLYDEQKVFEKYDLSPAMLIDFKALVGDASDNIPGVPGVGKKTALMLLKEFGSLEGIYEELERIEVKSPPKDGELTSPTVRGLTSPTVRELTSPTVRELTSPAEQAPVEVSDSSTSDKEIGRDRISAAGATRDPISIRIRKLLQENKEQAFLCKMLVSIKLDVPIDFNLKDCEWKGYNKEKVKEMLETFEFHSLIKRLPGAPEKKNRKLF